MAIHIIFIHSPALAIWGIVTKPVPNTMALGGVATGSMKASDEDMATAIINPVGSIPRAVAREAVTGSIIVAVQAVPNPTSMNPKQSKYQLKNDFIFNSS